MPDITEQDFLTSIGERPDDNLPRLVYADWLEGEGQKDRADFIRLQCELASLKPELPRLTATQITFPMITRDESDDYKRYVHPPPEQEVEVRLTEREMNLAKGLDFTTIYDVEVARDPNHNLFQMRLAHYGNPDAENRMWTVFMHRVYDPDTDRQRRKEINDLLSGLTERGKEGWLGAPMRAGLYRPVYVNYKRGFLDSLTCTWEHWLKVQEEVVRLNPAPFKVWHTSSPWHFYYTEDGIYLDNDPIGRIGPPPLTDNPLFKRRWPNVSFQAVMVTEPEVTFDPRRDVVLQTDVR
jgi:uncharacterized protein (TIGR02996 family)